MDPLGSSVLLLSCRAGMEGLVELILSSPGLMPEDLRLDSTTSWD